MNRRDVAQTDYNFTSERLSSQCRTLSLSILAFTWLFITRGAGEPPLQLVDGRIGLLVIGFCFASLIADGLQYLFGYLDSEHVLEEIDNADGDGLYDQRSRFRRARIWSFWTKLFFVSAAIVSLLVLVGRAVTI